MLYNYWSKVWVIRNNDLLLVHSSSTSSLPIETIHLDKVVAVIESQNFPGKIDFQSFFIFFEWLFQDKQFTFQVNTQQRVFNFLAKSADEVTRWVTVLDSMVKKLNSQRESLLEEDEESDGKVLIVDK